MSLRHTLAGCALALASLSSHAACPSNLPLSPNTLVPAPQLIPETQWRYQSSPEFPQTVLTFKQTDGDLNHYAVGDAGPLTESASHYTATVPSRKGLKQLIRFPFRLNDRWNDDFTEVGEYRREHEHYVYQYHEMAYSKVAAIESVTVAAGTFMAYRIDRTAYWEKTQPRALEDDQQGRPLAEASFKVDGTTLSQIWYVPALGRAVLRAQLRLGDSYYASSKDRLLDWGNTLVIELVEWTQGNHHCARQPHVKGRYPEQYLPIGYAVAALDSWEWPLQMRDHTPQTSPAKP